MPLEVKWRNGVAQLHGTIDGRRVRRSTKTRDPQVAEIKRIETEARLTKASIYGAEAETTFADACLLYLRSKPEDWSGKKYVTPILDHFKTQRIATIKPGHIRKLAADLYPEAKASTRNRCVLKPARAIINFAADAGYCQPLWVKGFKEAKVYRDAADRWWIDQFREHAVNPYIKAMALFMWVTAARIGECVIMRPEHLQLDQKRARLEKTKPGDPRIYYLTDELVRELRLLPPRRVNYGRGELRVFGYSDHHGVRIPWRETCERAGIPHLTPHEAGRHGFGTEMLVRQKQTP